MPAVGFICTDKEKIQFDKCFKACRMGRRCATLAYLRLISYDREWRGVTPSMAGNGPRLEYLKKTKPYYIDPSDRVFAALGTGVHGKLALHTYNENILAEEPLSDDQTEGTPDCLEPDESKKDFYVLTDYKTWGSFKVAKALGIVKTTKDVPILDEEGNPILLKSGPNKGKPKTKKEHTFETQQRDVSDVLETMLQLNRYRILFEKSGFPISRIQVQACVRDGGTYIAKGRGIEQNLYLIPIAVIPDDIVLKPYNKLAKEIEEADKTGYIRKCNEWESWDGRRCDGYCDVAEYCKEMGE